MGRETYSTQFLTRARADKFGKALERLSSTFNSSVLFHREFALRGRRKERAHDDLGRRALIEKAHGSLWIFRSRRLPPRNGK